MIKQHLTALIHRHRCDRAIILPMLDKLSLLELQALYRLLDSVGADARADGKHQGARQPWRHL